MESDSQDLHLQKIEEFVFDEDKIVTFTWLSNELSVSANDAKSLLERYVKDQRQTEPNNLCVTYTLCGELADDKGLSVVLLKEDDVEVKEKLFKTVTSKHIFSVQKCKEFNATALALVEHLNVNEPGQKPVLGSIISKNCIKRIFKEKKHLPVQKPTLKEKTKPSLFGKVESNVKPKLENSKPAGTPQTKNVETKVPPSKQTKQNGFVNFFTKGPISKSQETKKDSPEKENKNSTNVEKKNDNNSKVKNNENDNLQASRVKEELMDVDDDDFDDDFTNSATQKSNSKPESTSKESSAKNKNKSSASKSRKSNKRQRKDNDSQKTTKKRRRIIQESDSDSDDIFAGDRDDSADFIEISDQDEPVYKAPEIVLAPKNKKRFLKEVTSMDEEGYLLTKKVWVSEDPSDDEEDKNDEGKPEGSEKHKEKTDKKEEMDTSESKTTSKQSKTESTTSKKKDSPPMKKGDSQEDLPASSKSKKGKKNAPAANQPTLMNFFKKK